MHHRSGLRQIWQYAVLVDSGLVLMFMREIKRQLFIAIKPKAGPFCIDKDDCIIPVYNWLLQYLPRQACLEKPQIICRSALQLRYVSVCRVYVPLRKAADNTACFVNGHIPHVDQGKRQSLRLLSVLVFFLQILWNWLAKTLPAVLAHIFRKVMPPLDYNHFIIQLILLNFFSCQHEYSATLRTLFIFMLLVFCDFLLRKALQFRFRMSGLPAPFSPCFLPRVRDGLLLVQRSLAGRRSTVRPVLIDYPMKPGDFFFQCCKLCLRFFIPQIQLCYQGQGTFFLFSFDLVYHLQPGNFAVLLRIQLLKIHGSSGRFIVFHIVHPNCISFHHSASPI